MAIDPGIRIQLVEYYRSRRLRFQQDLSRVWVKRNERASGAYDVFAL
jgi:hypothetical protein